MLAVLDEQGAEVQRLVKNTGVVFGALNQNEAQLHNLITNSSDVFSATQKEKEALAATFRIFPTFLDESKATFAKLETFSKNTDPLIQQLRRRCGTSSRRCRTRARWRRTSSTSSATSTR